MPYGLELPTPPTPLEQTQPRDLLEYDELLEYFEPPSR